MHPITPIIYAHFEGIYSMLCARIGITAEDLAEEFGVLMYNPMNKEFVGMGAVLLNILVKVGVEIEAQDFSTEKICGEGNYLMGFRGRTNEALLKPMDWYMVEFTPIKEHPNKDRIVNVYKSSYKD